MATSTSIKLFNPVRVSLVLNLFSLFFFIMLYVGFYIHQKDETSRLTQIQLNTLIKSSAYLLEERDYRSFIEVVGGQLKEVSISIKEDGQDVFSQSQNKTNSLCQSSNYTLHKGASAVLSIQMCRQMQFSKNYLIGFSILWFIIAFSSYCLLSYLEKKSVHSFASFLEESGVKMNAKINLSQLLAQIGEIQMQLSKEKEKSVSLGKAEELGSLAAQLAHDLRSPVGALKVISKNLNELGADSSLNEILKVTTQRILGISDVILDRRKTILKDNQKVDLLKVCKDIIQEIIVLSPAVEISIHPLGNDLEYLVIGNEVELKRMLSNLIHNAIEAVDDKNPKINLSLKKVNSKIQLDITDNGSGFAKEVLDVVGIKEVTHNKKNGNGLGLLHAFRYMKSTGGFIQVSNLNSGAQVNLNFISI